MAVNSKTPSNAQSSWASVIILTVGLVFLPGRSAVWAVDLGGVTMVDTVRAGDLTLELNGAGLRKILFFKVYVAGLYLEQRTSDGSSVIRQDKVRQVTMHMLREVSGQNIVKAIRRGFERNSAQEMPLLEERLKRLGRLFPSTKRNDVVSLRYAPGVGTTVILNGERVGVIKGKDFADALLAVWLGRDPVQKNLKTAMLGGSP